MIRLHLVHPGAASARPQTREDVMRRIYHTMHFEVHDEQALHEFVRKHADPEELASMEQLDANQAEGDPVDHVYSDIEWIVENGHAFEADGLEHTGGETGDNDDEEDEEEEDEEEEDEE
jgi:hypothetical protein